MITRFLLLIVIFVAAGASSLWGQGILSSDEVVMARAKQILLQKYPLTANDCELQAINRLNSTMLGVEKPTYSFPRVGPYWVGLEITKEGKLIRTLVLQFKVVRHIDVICAARQIKGKDMVVIADLVKEKRTVDAGSSIDKSLVTSIDYFEGKRARYFIPEGTIITREKLEPIPPVRKYEDARVLVKRDEFAVESVGKALEDGFYGSRVRVRLQNGKILQGILNDQGQVEITL
jgi:flagella basal body P-ring formation protein FlgA